MEDIYTILKVVLVGLAILGSLASAIITIVNGIKKKKASGETVSVKEIVSESVSALSSLIENDLPKFIADAEQLNGITGAVKKVIVMSNAALKCAELGLDYQANSGAISDAVETLVSLTNKVNTNKIKDTIVVK